MSLEDDPEEAHKKALSIMRQVSEAYGHGVTLNLPALEKAMRRVHAHLCQVESCDFVWENGARCWAKWVRVSFGIKCCEEHARIRDRSLM